MNREQRRTAKRMEGRKPPMQRIHNDTFSLAMYKATALTGEEVNRTITRVRSAFDAMRRGVATKREMACLCTAVELGLSIEQMGVVKGLSQQLLAAEDAILRLLGAAKAAPGGWKPPVCRGEQLTVIDEFIDLHKFQLEQISYGEYQRAWRMTVGRTRSKGGEVLKATTEDRAPLTH